MKPNAKVASSAVCAILATTLLPEHHRPVQNLQQYSPTTWACAYETKCKGGIECSLRHPCNHASSWHTYMPSHSSLGAQQSRKRERSLDRCLVVVDILRLGLSCCRCR